MFRVFEIKGYDNNNNSDKMVVAHCCQVYSGAQKSCNLITLTGMCNSFSPFYKNLKMFFLDAGAQYNRITALGETVQNT